MVNQEFPHLTTAAHRCYIGSAGVTLHSTDQLEDDEIPGKDQLLLLSPGEALQVADYILAHKQELETRDKELEITFESISQALLSLFTELWQREQFEKQRRDSSYTPTPFAFDRSLNNAYNQLVLDKEGMTQRWYEGTWVDKFSHEQQETLFWRYFTSHYREDLLEKFLPETQTDEEDPED